MKRGRTRAVQALVAVPALVVATALAGCSDASADLSTRLDTAIARLAEAGQHSVDVFLETDDSANVTQLCTTVDDSGDSVRSRSWLDGVRTDDGCAGTDVAYDVIVVPGAAYSLDTTVTASGYAEATTSVELSRELAAEVSAPILDIGSLPEVVDAAESVRGGDRDYELELSFAAMHPLLGDIVSDGAADLTGTLTLAFSAAGELVALTFEATHDDQTIVLTGAWDLTAPSAPIERPAEVSGTVALDDLDDLRSFAGLSG